MADFDLVDSDLDVTLDKDQSATGTLQWDTSSVATGEYTARLASDNFTKEYLMTLAPQSEADSKLIHRWYLYEDNAPFADTIGSADGTNNGTTQVTGDWVVNAARDGDGTQYIETTQLGTFGSDMANDFAIAFTIQGTDTGDMVLGVQNSGDSTGLVITTGNVWNSTAGEIEFALEDGNTIRVNSNGTTVDDGNPHRVVCNKTANSASGLEIYIDGSQITVANDIDEAFGSPTDFDVTLPFFAWNNAGTIERNLNIILDDICFYNNSLTSTEATSYNSPWT